MAITFLVKSNRTSAGRMSSTRQSILISSHFQHVPSTIIPPEVYRGYVFGNPVIPLVCDWMSRVIIYLRLLHGETAPSQLLLLRMHIVRQANDGMFDTREVQPPPNQSGW